MCCSQQLSTLIFLCQPQTRLSYAFVCLGCLFVCPFPIFALTLMTVFKGQVNNKQLLQRQVQAWG
jgi:hypothetical protein